MTITHATQTNRSLRKLFNCFDEKILPYLSDGILLAISGGPDSRALLESMALWPNLLLNNVVVCTVDHGLRAESKEESRLVKMRAVRLGFKAFLENIIPNKNNEAFLREKRYQILCDLAKENNIKSIVTAHHRDDNAEGFLLAVAGLGGGYLGEGMPSLGHMNGLNLLRPFLSLSKADLMLPLALLDKTDYAHDSLDEDRAGQRAYVRHEILPHLNNLSLNLKERLAFFSENQRVKNEAIQKKALELITWNSNSELQIDLSKDSSKGLIEQAIREAIKKCSKNRDLRSSNRTLYRLLDNIWNTKGLDRKTNLFKVNDLKEKVYLFSGAKVIAQRNFLIIKRV